MTIKQEFGTLLQAAFSGDDKAAADLLLASYDRLAAHLRMSLPPTIQSTTDVEDIIQETYTVAWRAIRVLDRHNDEYRFYCWLERIADRKLIDHIRFCDRIKRGRGRRQVNGGSQDTSFLGKRSDGGPTPSSVAAGYEVKNDVRTAMQQLSKNHRQILQLRYLEGLSSATVASRLNLTEGAVNMLAKRARGRLRILMGSDSKYFGER